MTIFVLLLNGALALTPPGELSHRRDATAQQRHTRLAVLRTAAVAGTVGPCAPALAIPPMQDVLAAIDAEQAKANDPGPEVLYTPPSVKGESSPEALALAKHLKSRGAKMYGAYWCLVKKAAQHLSSMCLSSMHLSPMHL